MWQESFTINNIILEEIAKTQQKLHYSITHSIVGFNIENEQGGIKIASCKPKTKL